MHGSLPSTWTPPSMDNPLQPADKHIFLSPAVIPFQFHPYVNTYSLCYITLGWQRIRLTAIARFSQFELDKSNQKQCTNYLLFFLPYCVKGICCHTCYASRGKIQDLVITKFVRLAACVCWHVCVQVWWLWTAFVRCKCSRHLHKMRCYTQSICALYV